MVGNVVILFQHAQAKERLDVVNQRQEIYFVPAYSGNSLARFSCASVKSNSVFVLSVFLFVFFFSQSNQSKYKSGGEEIQFPDSEKCLPDEDSGILCSFRRSSSLVTNKKSCCSFALVSLLFLLLAREKVLTTIKRK